MNAVIPAAMAHLLMASMLAKTLATAATPPSAKLCLAGYLPVRLATRHHGVKRGLIGAGVEMSPCRDARRTTRERECQRRSPD
jgi:hypothetical protein